MREITEALRRWFRAYADDSGPATAITLLIGGLATLAVDLAGLWNDLALLDVDRPFLAHGVLLVVGCVGVLWRRTRPTLALVIGVVAFLLDLTIGGSLALLLVLFDILYAGERFAGRRTRRALRIGVVVAVAAAVVATVAMQASLQAVVFVGLQVGAILGVPIWWAANLRQAHELAQAAQERADLEAARAADAERARDAERRVAVRGERSRMARELHDAVAGDVSAVVIRASAALAGDVSGQDRDSLAAIRDSGLHALAELRSMIDVLTEDGGAEPVAPLLTDEGAALARRFGARTRGAPPPDLPDDVDRAGYRILQESLANATRHGAGELQVSWGGNAGALTMTVTNATHAEGRLTLGHGWGLVNMAERARAVGGSLEAGLRERTWEVRAVIPVTERQSVGVSP